MLLSRRLAPGPKSFLERSRAAGNSGNSKIRHWEFQHRANVLVLTNKEQQNDLIYPLVMSK